MKRKKLFIGILLLSIGLAGCENDLTNPVDQSGPSKTTILEDDILLWAKYYTPKQAASLPNWGDVESGNGGWWECDTHNLELKLSNLMPNGEIKNNTSYEVTISGTTTEPLERFQFGFTVPDILSSTLPWTDLSDFTDDPIEGEFSITKELRTYEAPKDHNGNYLEIDGKLSNAGILAFTNDADVPLVQEGTDPFPADEIKAILTNVVITITEK